MYHDVSLVLSCLVLWFCRVCGCDTLVCLLRFIPCTILSLAAQPMPCYILILMITCGGCTIFFYILILVTSSFLWSNFYFFGSEFLWSICAALLTLRLAWAYVGWGRGSPAPTACNESNGPDGPICSVEEIKKKREQQNEAFWPKKKKRMKHKCGMTLVLLPPWFFPSDSLLIFFP